MKLENLKKLEIASVVILSNEKGELIPAMIMEFREMCVDILLWSKLAQTLIL